MSLNCVFQLTSQCDSTLAFIQCTMCSVHVQFSAHVQFVHRRDRRLQACAHDVRALSAFCAAPSVWLRYKYLAHISNFSYLVSSEEEHVSHETLDTHPPAHTPLVTGGQWKPGYANTGAGEGGGNPCEKLLTEPKSWDSLLSWKEKLFTWY